MKRILVRSFCGLLIYFVIVARASSLPEHTGLASANYQQLADTTRLDTLKPTRTEFRKFKMKNSPWLAVLQSAVLPGLGQLYNRSYWKIPVILGLTGYLGYEVYNNNKKYLDYRAQYTNSQTETNPSGDLNLQTLRNFYRDQRDEFIWYLTIVYVINLVDAYVDAHLLDFDVREQKFESLGFRYSVPHLRLTFHF